MTLAERCSVHADKMQDEGWYVTANVLASAAERLALLDEVMAEAWVEINGGGVVTPDQVEQMRCRFGKLTDAPAD